MEHTPGAAEDELGHASRCLQIEKARNQRSVRAAADVILVDFQLIQQVQKMIDGLRVRCITVEPDPFSEAMAREIRSDDKKVGCQLIDVPNPMLGEPPQTVDKNKGRTFALVKDPRPHALHIDK